MTSWQRVLGRVIFVNCDPLFQGLAGDWEILPAPPAWLTGHLLQRDCLVAPIPAADYAQHMEELQLLPDVGILSRGAVGSVLLFGRRPPEQMRDVALPSDSATSRRLLMWWLRRHGADPRVLDTGPDLDAMLKRADGALLIGDRALDERQRHPDLVQLDLGQAWEAETRMPMVYGVFAARRDAPRNALAAAHRDIETQLRRFEQDDGWRSQVVAATAARTGFSVERLTEYFGQVHNRLVAGAVAGLEHFLAEVCDVREPIMWFDPAE